MCIGANVPRIVIEPSGLYFFQPGESHNESVENLDCISQNGSNPTNPTQNHSQSPNDGIALQDTTCFYGPFSTASKPEKNNPSSKEENSHQEAFECDEWVLGMAPLSWHDSSEDDSGFFSMSII